MTTNNTTTALTADGDSWPGIDAEVDPEIRAMFRQAYRRYGLPLPAHLRPSPEEAGESFRVVGRAIREAFEVYRRAWSALAAGLRGD